MVGIGGGVPPKVRLGDVVVSTPGQQFPGVVQWDIGKRTEGGKFERTGSLNSAPTSLLTALSKLETANDLYGSKIPEILDEAGKRLFGFATKYLNTDSLEDILFRADYGHMISTTTEDDSMNKNLASYEEQDGCISCDMGMIVKRKPREVQEVHYGLIASGNQVVKDATFRDELNKQLGGKLLCIEMEAAGLMNNFPCLVIRGICDYADSHKNKDWQGYAAARAAAFAKELLGYVEPGDVQQELSAKDLLGQGD